jgi:hypothetical protein
LTTLTAFWANNPNFDPVLGPYNPIMTPFWAQ